MAGFFIDYDSGKCKNIIEVSYGKANQARARGLLARAKGKTGFVIGKSASDDTYTAYISRRMSDCKPGIRIRTNGGPRVEREPSKVVEGAVAEGRVGRGVERGRPTGGRVHGEGTTTGDGLSSSGGSSTKDLDTSARRGLIRILTLTTRVCFFPMPSNRRLHARLEDTAPS